MALPVLDSILAPATASTGTAFDVDILAHDPDARNVQLDGAVTNTVTGETSTQSVVVAAGAPLRYTLTSADAGASIAAGSTPGTFSVVIN